MTRNPPEVARLVEKGLDPDAGLVPRAEFLRMEALMVRWRIAAQRWTPGGSEFMDPDACEAFIRQQRQDHTVAKLEVARLTKALRDRAA